MEANNVRILLESDTNELEIVEFCVNEGIEESYFGVNVAKVREIIRRPKLTTVASAPESIAGMMSLREKVIPVIDLAKILGKHPDKDAERIVVLEFNRMTVGVMVNSVSRIYRLSWEQIEAPGKMSESVYVTGMVKMQNRIILILDFERIFAELSASSVLHAMEDQGQVEHKAAGNKVLVVDDSSFIRSSICSALRKVGYVVEEAINGEEAWKIIEGKLESGAFDIDLIITDIEMPQMDGLHLTSLIRKESRLAGIPLYIFSSLASEDNMRKWQSLGADGILTKPDLPNLVDIVGTTLATKKK